jgi:hypothetical protein
VRAPHSLLCANDDDGRIVNLHFALCILHLAATHLKRIGNTSTLRHRPPPRGRGDITAQTQTPAAPTTLLRTSGFTSSEIEMITKQPHHEIPERHKVYQERLKPYRQGL